MDRIFLLGTGPAADRFLPDDRRDPFAGLTCSPAAAVGWHFAPIFNLYWVVKWARDVNRFGSGTDRGTVLRGTAIGLLLLVGLIVHLFVPVIGTIVSFGAMQWLVSKTRNAIAKRT